MSEIITVDFNTKTILHRNKIIKIEDPVLLEVQSSMSEENFKIYKATIDDWMERNFKWQLKNNAWTKEEVNKLKESSCENKKSS